MEASPGRNCARQGLKNGDFVKQIVITGGAKCVGKPKS